MNDKPTPEEKIEFIHSKIRDLQSAEQRRLNDVNQSITAAAKNGGRDGPHCVVNPQRLPRSAVEASVDYLETQLLCSTRAFVYSFYLSKLEALRPSHTAEKTVQMLQRALSFSLARKAADKVNRSISWLKTGAAEAELAALGELQLVFLEADTGDLSGEVL